MHFAEPIVLLTAVHFHFTGFALPIVAGATGLALGKHEPIGHSTAERDIFRFVATGIIGGPAIVAAGFVFSSALLKLVGAWLLAIASIGLAGFLLSVLPWITPRLAKVLLSTSAVSLVVGMTLAATYAVGEFTERYWLLIPQMARLYGTANALGFTLCGLLGWALAAGTEKHVRKGLRR
jgi:YndJ-like protein